VMKGNRIAATHRDGGLCGLLRLEEHGAKAAGAPRLAVRRDVRFDSAAALVGHVCSGGLKLWAIGQNKRDRQSMDITVTQVCWAAAADACTAAPRDRSTQDVWSGWQRMRCRASHSKHCRKAANPKP